MGILDDVFVNAKSAAGMMSKKAVDIYDISKLKLSAANLKNELNKKYRAYGKAVYNKEGTEVCEGLENEIADIKENLADVIKLYDSIKNSVVCATCGERMPKDARFCPVCGTEQTADVNFCPYCEHPVDADSFYCMHCGKKIDKQ